ncbi:hypothetical protein AB0K92_16480 [Streptomyces sp. NPDC052687]|uniref:hypothetical protein n=1 Tax=Streptomyces sp. NPDC052687 TaxID=3154759 RepID=UPI003435D963
MRGFGVLSVLLLGVLVACGPAREPAAPDAGPERALPREVTAEESATLRRAELVLERRCMARAGFDLPPVPEPARTGPPPPPMRLVLADTAWAREHGYGSLVGTPGQSAAARAEDPVERYVRGLTPQRRAAALRAWQGGGRDTVEVTLPSGMTTGRSTRGCTSEARGELYGDFRTWFGADAVDRDVVSLALSRAEADPAVTEALRDWSACVAGRGLPHASPHRLRAALGTSAPEAEEIRYAVAEADCAVSSGLAEAAADAERRHLSALRAQYRADVANARGMRLAALPKAERIVRGEDPPRQDTLRGRGTT